MANTGPIEVVPASYSYVFSPYREPAARVQPGQRVTIQCDDAFESRISRQNDVMAGVVDSATRREPVDTSGTEEALAT